MNILLFLYLIENQSSYVELLEFSIPFILGLFASLSIDTLRNGIKDRKNRKFIKFYLKNSVLKNLPQLNSDYKTVKTKIETYTSGRKNTISAHEDFNTKVLDSISSSDYYSAFRKNFILVNEINSMIGFLSQSLPSQINNRYYNFLNSHLKEQNKVGDKEHVMECSACKQEQVATIDILEGRIKEIDILTQKIKELIR